MKGEIIVFRSDIVLLWYNFVVIFSFHFWFVDTRWRWHWFPCKLIVASHRKPLPPSSVSFYNLSNHHWTRRGLLKFFHLGRSPLGEYELKKKTLIMNCKENLFENNSLVYITNFNFSFCRKKYTQCISLTSESPIF